MAQKRAKNRSASKVKKSKESDKELFVQHLVRASRIVKSWPTWKQQLLGGTIKVHSPQVSAS